MSSPILGGMALSGRVGFKLWQIEKLFQMNIKTKGIENQSNGRKKMMVLIPARQMKRGILHQIWAGSFFVSL